MPPWFATFNSWIPRFWTWRGRHFAGVERERFAPFAAEQSLLNWCWAACAQMILNWHGVIVSQAQIVERVFGLPIDLPANAPQILEALTSFGQHLTGRPAAINGRLAPGPAEMLDDLRDGQLLMAGLSDVGTVGHAYVVTGMTFEYSLFGGSIIPVTVTLFNPSPFQLGWEEIAWSDFVQRVQCVFRVRVTSL